MIYTLTRTTQEVDEVLNKAGAAAEEGSVYPGMTYEQGVEMALQWALEGGAHPFDED